MELLEKDIKRKVNMALIKCYECGAEISDKASVCPHCGAPVKQDAQIENSVAGNEVKITADATEKAEKKKGGKKVAVIGAIVGILAVAGVLAFVFFGNRKASDEKIRQEAENVLALAQMSGANMAIGGAGRDEATGVAKVLYVVSYEGTSHDFYSMDDSVKQDLDNTCNTLLQTLSGSLEDALKEEVAVGINIMSSPGEYEFLGTSIHQDAEIVAEYYDYGSDERNQQMKEAAEAQAEADEAQKQSDYEKLVDLVKNEKYAEAEDFYTAALSDYADAKQYYYFAKAMVLYDNKFYGQAYETYEEECAGFAEAEPLKKKLEDEILPLDGIYQNESVDYPMYICIYHGQVSTEMPSSYSKPKKTIYVQKLFGYEFTGGKKGYGIGYTASLGADPNPEYVMGDMEGGKFLVAAAPGASYTTFAGVYKKVSDTAPTP